MNVLGLIEPNKLDKKENALVKKKSVHFVIAVLNWLCVWAMRGGRLSVLITTTLANRECL